MSRHPLAGTPAPAEMLIDVDAIQAAFTSVPASQPVRFGTSGHRGSALAGSFNEAHIAAISQALAEHRQAAGITGPLFMGRDTHALSWPAHQVALEVLSANGVSVHVAAQDHATPTPVISHAILTHNRDIGGAQADGVVITPSHNPPADGGFKYNPPHGGPAEGSITAAVEARANELLASGLKGVRRGPGRGTAHDYASPYIDDLDAVIDMQAIADAGLRLAVDPLGGAAVSYWEPLAQRWNLDLTVVNPAIDPTFGFMTLDHDGKIRMDCSSADAMAGLIANRERFDLAFGNDPDVDRHGIVTPLGGLLNPNHYLAAAIWYLVQHRPHWPARAAIGKTLVSSSMIDRVVAELGRPLAEVPVGFKWFVDGLHSGSYLFGGEESAGASFLRRDGSVWTTDKDGIIMNLLAAEMTGRLGMDPHHVYKKLEQRFGSPSYARVDAPANDAQKAALSAMTSDLVTADSLAGDPISAVLTRAAANDAPLGGLKVVTSRGWFAARPSGTEAIYKIYAESFAGPAHLATIQEEARQIVDRAFRAAGV